MPAQVSLLPIGIGLLLLLSILSSAVNAQERTGSKASAVDQCVACHSKQEGEMAAPVNRMQHDIHRQFGLSCADCHGGDRTAVEAEEAMSPSKGFTGSPATAEVPRFCGRCHSDAAMMKRFNPATRVDQEAEYATSIHGKRLAGGDSKVATCISCHGVHGILAINDPNAPVYPLNVAATCGRCHSDPALMQPYGIPTNQASLYATSVHSEALVKKQDLTAPTCNDCHGNHGATPPGVASVAYVCGTCHVRQSEFFERSPHRQPFEEAAIAGCIACHSNHGIKHPTDALIGTASGSICVQCHSEGEKGFAAAAAMGADLARLAAAIDTSSRLLARAANAGMEVSRPQFDLKDARDKLINARVVVHTLSREDLDSLVKGGLATTVKTKKSGEQALEDLDFRRSGLAVSLVVILAAAVSIYAKVRQIERRHARRKEALDGTGSIAAVTPEGSGE
jgi:predicted CXXCH cytochrome family protein